jgi:hypothetical protein
MSKIIYIVHNPNNNNRDNNRDIEKLEKIGLEILPDNITPNPTKYLKSENSIAAIYNPVTTIPVKDTSICMGYTSNVNWSNLNCKSEEIDGSYAIYRNTEACFQVVSDMVASRAVWYYKDGDVFIASSSQRAIIIYLGSFEFNNKVIPWMLSSGTIGPGLSYDKRLSLLEPNSLLSLNKEKWILDKTNIEIKLTNNYISKQRAKTDLKKAIETSFAKLEIDYNKFVLPLSGGYDSRGILLFLKNKIKIKTITWGVRESLEEKDNDAYIAKKLANKVGVENYFFESYKEGVLLKESLDKFLANSEGRIDHIGGYLDGMAMWKAFFENGFECIIRGDELVGLSNVSSELEARRDESLTVLSDYYNIDKKIIAKLPKQSIPQSPYDDLYKTKGYWAIFNEHPIVFSALNDIKLSYVEIFNPLLSASIINVVTKMFDKRFIGDKQSFKDIVDELCDVAIAKKGANKPLEKVLSSLEMKKEVHHTLSSFDNYKVIDKEIIDYALANIKFSNKMEKKNINKTEIIRKLLPDCVIKFLRRNVNKREMDWNSFAFRIYIVVRMIDIFNKDSNIIEK